MNKIELEMLGAIASGKNWSSGNTSVEFSDAQVLGIGKVTLHGHTIAIIMSDKSIKPVVDTLRAWPTATTKSRLRALGVNVYTKNHTTYLDGEAI